MIRIFPVTDGSNYKGNIDFYLRKYDVSTNNVVFSKYWGTSEQEYSAAMEVENDIIYFSGLVTSSVGWPHTVIYGSYTGISHIVFTKINGTNGNVTYSTWLSSNSNEEFASMKVANGNMYIIGLAYGAVTDSYPVTNGSKKRGSIGAEDVILTKINANNQICFSTFVGGNSGDVATGITIQNDLVYYVGYTSTNDYPVTNSITKKACK